MKYLFAQPVYLGGKLFPAGIRDVSEKNEADPHFLKFVGAGFIKEVEAAPEPLLNNKQRAERLLEKILSKPKKAVKVDSRPEEAPKEAVKEEPASEAKDETVSEDADFYEAEAPKSKKKK